MGAIISVMRRFICWTLEKLRKNKKDDHCSLKEILIVQVEEPKLYENIEEKKEEIIKRIVGDECSLEDIRIEEPKLHENHEEKEEENIKIKVGEEKWINNYSSSQKILLVGEGDFSFSASLAMAFSSASNIIATSLDSREFLRQNYGRAIFNIENLKNMGCNIMHGVDATKMVNHPLLKGVKFDRIIFNFPFAGFFKTESRKSQLSRHQLLVSLFLENAKEMINEEGEIHITHKTNGFHSEWNIMPLGFRHGLRLVGTVHFKHTDYPGYSSKCGFGGDNFFNCNPSKTYKFGLAW